MQVNVSYSLFDAQGKNLKTGNFKYSVSYYALTLSISVLSTYAGLPSSSKNLTQHFLQAFQRALSKKQNFGLASRIQKGKVKPVLKLNPIDKRTLLYSFGCFIMGQLHGEFIYMSNWKGRTILADGNGDVMYFHRNPIIPPMKKHALNEFHTFFNPKTFTLTPANCFDVSVVDPSGDGSLDYSKYAKEQEELENNILSGLGREGTELLIARGNDSFEIWLSQFPLPKFSEEVDHSTDGKMHIYVIPHLEGRVQENE